MMRLAMWTRVKQVVFAANVFALGLVAVVYLLSYAVGYTLFVTQGGRCWMLDTLRGEVSVWTGPVGATKKDDVSQRVYDAQAGFTVEQIFAKNGDEHDYLPRTLGFGYGRTNVFFSGPPVAPGGVVYLLVSPYWFVMMILSVPPVKRLARRWHQARLKRPRREAFPVFASPRA